MALPSTKVSSAKTYTFLALAAPVALCAAAVAQQLPTPNEPKITVQVNSVLVPVAVYDAHDRALADLKKEDFHLFDRDKPQSISGFTVETRLAPATTAPNALTEPPNTASSALKPMSPYQRFVVFLFDDFHLSLGDLLRAQKVAAKMLAESLSPSDLAAVVSFSGANSGLTRDQTVLQQTVAKLKVQPLFHHDDRACPNIDVNQADLIENKHNQRALELAMEAYTTCAHVQGALPSMVEHMVRSAASQTLAVSEQDVHLTLGTIREFVGRLATLPGQRTIILISPGFLTVTGEAMSEKSRVLDAAAHDDVTISALDARGLYTTGIDASELGVASTQDLMQNRSAQNRSESMSQAEDVMAELADGTGGTFFHNNNDLEGGFKTLTQAPECVYLLEFSLDQVKPDGTYHPLKVKVDRDGVKVKARHGYFAPAPEKTKKK